MKKKNIIASILGLSALLSPAIYANADTSDDTAKDVEIRWEIDENGNELSKKQIDEIYNNLDKKDRIIEDSKTTESNGNGSDNKVTFTN